MFQRIETGYKKVRRLFSRSEWLVWLLGLDNHGEVFVKDKAYAAHPVGLILVKIEGLGHDQLIKAISNDELPFVKRLLNREHYECVPMYSGLPSATAAVQGELLYGVKSIVASYPFRGHAITRDSHSVEADNAHRIQNELNLNGSALLTGGSTYCDIYAGGATESHFCASTSEWNTVFSSSTIKHWGIVLLLNIPTLFKVIALMFIELILAVVDLIKGVITGRSVNAELKSLVARVMVSILLRDLITIGGSVDIARGLPVIHINYKGYDKQGHRRGPDSAFAHWTLKGIDKCIERLWSANHRNIYRHYDLWIYSDHGQERTTPYKKLTGYSIDSAVDCAYNDTLQKFNQEINTDAESLSSKKHLSVDIRYHGKTSIEETVREIVEKSHEPNRLGSLKYQPHSPVTTAQGTVGHLYLDNRLPLLLQSELASQLVQYYQVPAAVVTHTDSLEVHMPGGVTHIPGGETTVLGASHPFHSEISADLLAMCRHRDAGDIVLFGCVEGLAPVSFETENGAHAGIGPNETRAFAVIPVDTVLAESKHDYITPGRLHEAAHSILNPTTLKTPLAKSTYKNQKPYLANQSHQLKIMTYNVHSCIGMDNIASTERIARVISRYKPDIIALQELDVNRTRSKNIHQASLIAKLLDMEFHFHPSLSEEHEQYGDAIISSLPMQLVKAAALPKPASMPSIETRGALWVGIDFHGITLQVINTHLGLRSKERKLQAEALLGEEWLSHPDCIGPTILCGDLNTVPGSQVIQSFAPRFTDVQSHLPGINRKKTFSSRIPTLQIGYILADRNFETHSVVVLSNELTKVASDHLPIMASLSFK